MVAYLLFWRLGEELELHKIAVDRPWQRQGHAARLLEFFLQAGRSWGSERAVLEVRESNVAAIRLYEKFAFRPVGRRSDYYTLPVEDARVYEFDFKGTGDGVIAIRDRGGCCPRCSFFRRSKNRGWFWRRRR